MANKFVWSGATGANDGSSWQDAYVSLMRDWGAEPGFTSGTDFIYVRSTHNENNAVTVTLTGTTAEGTEDQVRILCVTGNDTGTDPGTLTTGGKVNTTDVSANIRIDEKIYVYGVEFLSKNFLSIAYSNADHDIILESCRLELTDTGGSERIEFGSLNTAIAHSIRLLSPTIDFAVAGQGIQTRNAKIVWVGGSVAFDVNTLFANISSGSILDINIVNADLSILSSSTLVPATVVSCNSTVIFSRCLLASGMTLVSGTIDVPGFEVSFHHCQSGTDSDPAYQMKRYTYQGTVETDVARYRTGGASDGERTNPYSWSMDTAAGSNVIELYEPLESPPIAGWTDGDASTAHTYRVYVASGATLQNDECWVELIGPNDAATDSLGVRKTTRPNPMATPANLTTDATSTWNGADVTTKQQIDITYTPDKPGPITARIYVAKPAERVSVDPKVYIDP